MELNDLVGRWQKKEKGLNSYTITTYNFSKYGTYNKFEETSMFISNPMGSITNSSTSSDKGTFKITDSGKIEVVSDKYGRSDLSMFSLGSRVA